MKSSFAAFLFRKSSAICSIFLYSILFLQHHQCYGYFRSQYYGFYRNIYSSSSSFPITQRQVQLQAKGKLQEKEKTFNQVEKRDILERREAKIPIPPSSLAKPQGNKLQETQPTLASALSASSPNSIFNTTEIDSIIANMPLSDKYALLIQSYSGKILESSSSAPDSSAAATSADRDLMKKLEALYSEMILRDVEVGKKSIQGIVDAASTFCNVELLAKTIKLLKKGGDLKAFGVAVGQLTTPIFQDLNSTYFSNNNLPSDAREKEVSYAIGAIIFTINWIAFQFLDVFIHNLNLYNLLISLLFGGLLLYDIFYRKAEEIQLTIAGFERLIFRDNNRQSFLDACSFVSGYLLGLPSFCYTSGINEGLKMIETYPYSLQVYKQPFLTSSLLNQLRNTFTSFSSLSTSTAPSATIPTTAQTNTAVTTTTNKKKSNSLISEEQFQNIVQQFKVRLAVGEKPDSLKVDLETPASSENNRNINGVRFSPKESIQLDSLFENSLYDYLWNEEDRKFALGRILIWFMIPVAAEMAKYGQTMLSDPARGGKFLDSVITILKNTKGPIDDFVQASYASGPTSYTFSSSNERVITKSSIEFQKIASLLPKYPNDQKALLEWAYYEANCVLRQYGEVFESVHEYLKTGTATVGECTLLIEEQLT